MLAMSTDKKAGIETTLADVALEQYGLRASRLKLLKERPALQLFHVLSEAGEEYVFRIYRLADTAAERGALTGSIGVRRRQAQLLWMTALQQETNISVPEPVPRIDGALMSHLSVPEGPKLCVLLRWVPGKTKIPRRKGLESPTEEELVSVGTYIAQLHQFSESFAAADDGALPRRDWDYLFSESRPLWRKGEAVFSERELEVFEEVAKRVQRDLIALGETNNVFGVIHSDLQLPNFVFQQGAVVAIDFDECAWGHYLYDIAGTLWGIEKTRAPIESLQAPVLEGYRRVRPLQQSYLEHLPTFVAMRLVEQVNKTLSNKEMQDRKSWLPFLSNPAKRLEALMREGLVSDTTTHQ